MRETVSVHIGECGIALGKGTWKQIIFEEGITKEGAVENQDEDNMIVDHTVCFMETSVGKFVPRALWIDTENFPITELQSSPMKNLFASEFFMSSNSDTNSNYAIGKNEGWNMLEHFAIEGFRRVSEMCQSLGIATYTATMNGGTGSGVSSAMQVDINDFFPDIQQIAHSFTLDPNSTQVLTAPYNNVLALADSNFTLDSRVVFSNMKIMDVLTPVFMGDAGAITYAAMNHLQALVYSCCTSTSRWKGSNLTGQLSMNLVPFPKLILQCPSLFPLHNKVKAVHTQNEFQIAKQVFWEDNELACVDLFDNKGKFIACSLVWRGGEIQNFSVFTALRELMALNQLSFVEWMPTGIHIAHSEKHMESHPEVPYSDPPSGVMKLCSHTNIARDIEQPMVDEFTGMLEHKAYLHWYLAEGMEMAQFEAAREALQVEIDLYKHVAGASGTTEAQVDNTDDE